MKTPLATHHKAQGALLVNDRGIELPERFSEPLLEYQATREKAGLIDLSFRVHVRMTGDDRVSFLQGMLSNDVAVLQPGEGCAATLLTEQGRIVADVRAYALDTCFLLDVDARVKEKTIAALSHFLVADDVEMEDLSDQQVTLAVQGPLASDVLAAADVHVSLPKEFQHGEATIVDTPVRIVHANDTGEKGYEIFVPRARVEQVWQALMQAGEPLGLRPVGLTALHTLRVEAGIPWYGLDMDEGRLVVEVGLDHAISFSKGCYLGQEVVERATARGHANRKLLGLIVQSNTLPASGDKLFHDSQEVGWVTSAVISPRLGRAIALGYVRREYWAPGTRLRIDRQGTPMIAEVVALPFPR